MKTIKAILTSLLYKLGIKKKPVDKLEPVIEEEPVKFAGPQIINNTDAIFVHHNDNWALVVDYEFEDIPSWVEWDKGQQKLVVAQMGGSMTEISTPVNEEHLADYKDRKKLYLIANHKGDKIIHLLSFIERDD